MPVDPAVTARRNRRDGRRDGEWQLNVGAPSNGTPRTLIAVRTNSLQACQDSPESAEPVRGSVEQPACKIDAAFDSLSATVSGFRILRGAQRQAGG